MKKIVCGKFDNKINFNIFNNIKRVRLGSINPNKLNIKNLIPIAIQNKTLLYNEKLYEVRDFFSSIKLEKLDKLIVLTIKEKDLILEELIDFNIDLYVFEIMYPIFNHIRYITNIHKNYGELIKLLEITQNLGIYGKKLTKQLSMEYSYKIERKLRFKNSYDKFFGFAYKGPYQEVFKLKEERKDRVIISFDFNSMFIDCMLGDFVDPKNILYKKYSTQNINIDDLSHGLYKVVLKNPKDTFFKNFHPFRYTRILQSFYFNLENNHQIEILLFKNELAYYKNFFYDFEIIEGFFSKRTIRHPLSNLAKEIYEDRVKYKENKNEIFANLMKLKLVTMHASSNPKKYKTSLFKTKQKLLEFLRNEYMLDLTNIDDEDYYFIKNLKLFTIEKKEKYFKLKSICFDKNESIYSLSSQILANSRLKMLQTIEKFLTFTSLEICYCNVDSIHISIIETELTNFFKKFDYMISNKIGDLKIEAIAKRGYWFDVGRYWLKDEKNVILFKNMIFNSKIETTNKFIKSKRIKLVHKYKSFTFIKDIYKNLYHSFSYNKKILFNSNCIDNINFNRYNFEEIKSLQVANMTINNEILNSKRVKINLFNLISTV